MTDSVPKKRKAPGVKLGISITQEQMDWLAPYADKYFYGKVSRAVQNLIEAAKDREAMEQNLAVIALETQVTNLTDLSKKIELLALDSPNDRMAAERAVSADLLRMKAMIAMQKDLPSQPTS